MEEQIKQGPIDPDLDLNFNTSGTGSNSQKGFPIKERFIWLKDDVWEDLDFNKNGPQEFMNKITAKKVFDDGSVAPPFHGDVIAGRDKNEKLVIFKLLLIEGKTRFGQKETPW
jgi:hypothetical protein